MLFCYSIKCGEWPYLFATIVANGKILLDIAGLEFGFEQTFVQKRRSKNVGEIDTWCQFYQDCMNSFCAKVFGTALRCLQFGFVIFWEKDVGAKAACKMLVKLTPVVNFINILCAHFVTIFWCQKLQS